MYPRNAASPPRIAVGAVVAIADGAVQTADVLIKVTPEGGAAGAGGGTTSYVEGIVHYVPTQAETNYTAFTVTAYKANCIPAAVTVVTTASATAGRTMPADGSITADVLGADALTAAKIADNAIGADQIAANAITASKIADDAITAAKFDESTAFPLKSADTGATAVARTGADSDTLETLSDQMDGVDTKQGAAQADLDVLTGADGATLATLQGNYAPAKAGAQMDLVNAPNATALTAIGAKVEAMVLDEGDATALLAAIAAKIEEFMINEGDATATIAAIAAACNAAVVAGTVGTNVVAIKGKTDNLPAQPAAVGSAMTLANDSISAGSISTAALNKLCKIMGVTNSVNAAGTEIKYYDVSGALVATLTKTGTDPIVWTAVFA